MGRHVVIALGLPLLAVGWGRPWSASSSSDICQGGTRMDMTAVHDGRGRALGIRVLAVALLVVVAVTTGCATIEDNPKTAVGGFGGAALGGLIAGAAGANPAAIAASVIGGALIGGLVGNFLDDRDKRLHAEAAQRALESTPSGTSVPWRNPDNGHAGTVTPTRTYQNAQGAYCREFQQTVTVDSKQERAYGTACRQPDGSWRIAS
jgi:surface antigen